MEALDKFTSVTPQPNPFSDSNKNGDNDNKQKPLKKQLEEAQATTMPASSPSPPSHSLSKQQQKRPRAATPPPKDSKTTQPEKESMASHMQRLQEKRRQEGDDLMDAGREELGAAHKYERQRLSFVYITLQVMLSPFRTLWLYVIAAFTQSQERYQQVAKHTKRTRHVRLLEPWMHFVRVAFLVDDRPVLQWMWYMVGMFLWPLVRVLGGGLLVDK